MFDLNLILFTVSDYVRLVTYEHPYRRAPVHHSGQSPAFNPEIGRPWIYLWLHRNDMIHATDSVEDKSLVPTVSTSSSTSSSK